MIPKRDVLGQIPYQPRNPFISERSTDQPWTPGPLGWNDYASRLYIKAGPKSKKGSGSRGKKKIKTKVLNIVTSFDNPWKGKIKEEIEALKNNRWAPSSDDFEALVNKSYTVNHFNQLLGIIIIQPKGSVKRINIFTHSNPDLIAFKGIISPRTTFVDVDLNITSALSMNALQAMTNGTWFKVGKSKKKHTIKDIQTRFANGAKVFFYSCKSATDPELLQEFANKFDVIAVGFKDNICYCPKYTTNTIDRKHVGVGRRCSGQGKDFSSVDSFATEYKPSNP